MNQAVPDPDVLIETRGALAIVTLNRPEAHNALSLEMIRQIRAALNGWAKDSAIAAVLFLGAGDKAFCSGGDIKAFYYSGMDCRRGLVTPRVPMVFFNEEYALNTQIFHYPKPTIAFMDGITMGGGYGIAGHCDVRIATPRTVFAMPEVGIGFFPDVGSVYQLLRCPAHYGRYLALTGSRLDGRSCVAAGLADFYVEGGPDIAAAAEGALGADDLAKALKEALNGADGFDLPHGALVEAAFADCNAEAICERLCGDGSEFARAALAALEAGSPTSIQVVAQYLEQAQGAGFDKVMAMDLAICERFILQQDMYEGIRARLIDKDQSPDWVPPTLEEVGEALVNTYFTPSGYDSSDVQIL